MSKFDFLSWVWLLSGWVGGGRGDGGGGGGAICKQ